MPHRTGPVGIGIIGAGVIAAQYLEQITSFPDTEVLAIGDLRPEAAAARAEEYGVPRHGDVTTVLDDPEVEIVVNLTIPAAHHAVSSSILEAGKHVWSEKPLTTSREDAASLLALAERTGLRVGCAPDTVLGAGIQSALRLLTSGEVGEPLGHEAAGAALGGAQGEPLLLQKSFQHELQGGHVHPVHQGPEVLLQLPLQCPRAGGDGHASPIRKQIIDRITG